MRPFIDYKIFVVFRDNKYDWPVPMPMGCLGRATVADCAKLWIKGGRDSFRHGSGPAKELFIAEYPWGPGKENHKPLALHLPSPKDILDCSRGKYTDKEAFEQFTYNFDTLMKTLIDNETERRRLKTVSSQHDG